MAESWRRKPTAEEIANSLDGYYEILGVAKNVEESALKRAYRKQSLKLHPDKRGGDTRAFQCLNRAFVVLRDAKRRKKYDILGLDCEDDAETTDAKSTSEEENGEHQLPATLSKESEIAREFVGGVGVRLLQILLFLQATQYSFLLLIVAIVAVGATAYSASSNPSAASLKSSIAATGGGLLAMIILWWSTPQGWIFWGSETAILFLGLLEGASWFVGAAGGRIVQVASFVVCAFFAWWLNGRFLSYVVAIFLVGMAWIGVFFFFLLAGLLIESTVETKLKLCAPKVRSEVGRLRENCARLREKILELEKR
eukprot:g897.t1